MIVYLDASLLVAALTEEARTAEVGAWLERQSSGTLAISPWVATEVSSALSLKVRVGTLKLEERNEALTGWSMLRRESFATIVVSSQDFEAAARFSDRHELNLRAGDALHIAIALANGCTLATLDRTMAAAALECGVAVADIAP